MYSQQSARTCVIARAHTCVHVRVSMCVCLCVCVCLKTYGETAPKYQRDLLYRIVKIDIKSGAHVPRSMGDLTSQKEHR